MPEIRCTYCHAFIAGVEYVEDYSDVVILYAHRTCHAQAAEPKLAAAEQKRVIALVGRICNRQRVPARLIWTAVYRFVVQHVRRKEPQP